MRRALAPLLLLTPLAACGNSTGTPTYSTLGGWRSQELSGAEIQMTLVETARSTMGAGHLVAGTEVAAFRATGAHADSTVSLLFDFDGRGDIAFEGRFRPVTGGSGKRVTAMVGSLFGGGYRGTDVTFVPSNTTMP